MDVNASQIGLFSKYIFENLSFIQVLKFARQKLN